MIKIKILWTGGFDSTFRIVQLSKVNCIIQPYYLSDNRKSESLELSAINDVTRNLLGRRETKCKIKPLIIINSKDVPSNFKITKAFENILLTDFFGTQYDWLARFAKINPGIELSIHEEDKATKIINKYGWVNKIDGEINYYVIDKEKSTKDVDILFGNFHLPLIKMTKLEMEKLYLENGYGDIVDLTWFCHKPINGSPCGQCNPCIYTIEEGLGHRLPKIALIRYIKEKIKRRLKSIVCIMIRK